MAGIARMIKDLSRGEITLGKWIAAVDALPALRPFTAPGRAGRFHNVRDLALAIAIRTPSMDPSPNQNLTDGLIRPPGSVPHSDGHQTAAVVVVG